VRDGKDLCPGHVGIACEHGLVPYHSCTERCGFCDAPCSRHRPAWPQCPGLAAAAS
jgi:hypothetical protein